MAHVVDYTQLIDRQQAITPLEQAIAQATKTVFFETLQSQLQDLMDYGCPQLGSQTVIERFAKQDGLVVLRRPSASNAIMRIIFSNWLSLASERGLGFLQFVLTMLWEDQWTINRLWHSTAKAERYPRFLSREYIPGYFLTSRIHLNIKRSVDLGEISELTPIIRQLVPANIVVSVVAEALNRDFERPMNVVMAGHAYQVVDLS